MSASPTKLIALCVLAGLVLAGGCKLDPYDTGGEGGWNFPDASTDDSSVGDDVEVQPDACVATEEVCDGVDNDCDNVIDNGFDLATDPFNCGACGTICEYDYAFATCDASQCAMGACLPGHWDNNQDDSDGCEYSCHTTNDGTEVCDGVDNDCDGAIDEDFDLQNDPNNCGGCHQACAFFQGVGACVAGNCELSSCTGGYVDKDGNPNNGCECMMDLVEGTVPCVQGGPATCDASTEVCADVSGDGSSFCATIPIDGCDGVDNDCDGTVDEDAPSQMAAGDCYTHPVGCTETSPGVYSCTGECAAGQPTCVGGEVVCGNQTGPAAELCDDLDNDCNGTVDDGYDKQNDPANCGGCGVQCSAVVANGIPGCVNGGCVVLACLPGFYDDNGDPLDGCEYACNLTNGGVEACGDFVDNDCDGDIDEGFDFTNDTQNCGACGNDCNQGVPFGTSVVGCVASTCTYACQTNFYDLNGDLSAGQAGNGCEYACTPSGAEVCDDTDNNCDGQIDEGVNKLTDVNNCGSCGYVCAAHVGANSVVNGCANGVCQFACAAGAVDLDGDVALGNLGTGCEYACTPSGAEVCDGADNDCDGQTDEDAAGGPLTQPCYTGVPAATEGVGPCHGGTQTCAGGTYGACVGQVTPQAEVCDGVDNDCDNLTDENASGTPLTQACYTGPAGTQGHGLCVGGTQSCTAGGWGVCAGEVTPAPDVCDGQDNDCDDSTDEDFNLQTDVLNCGSCGYQCTAHAGVFSYATGCSAGSCTYACAAGHYDNDGDVNLGNAGTGCEYACILSNGGVETCADAIDNDCDGAINEGFDYTTDENNCGACGYSCAGNTPFGATGNSCVASTCVYTCQTNYYDLDLDLGLGPAGTGCEYNCVATGGEVCDDADNDCDGLIDEDFNKDTNPNNCGACGYVCSAHAGNWSTATGCVNGNCQYVCQAGHYDLNGDISLGDGGDGCEYACTPSGVETCDGNDNDCDGVTDEDASGAPLTQPCYTGVPASTEGQGLCVGGTQTCTGGGWGGCAGEVTPQAELCDGLDNDCDNSTDEDFDTQIDLNNCGGCNLSCWASPPANSFPSACVAGSCVYTCLGGYNDIDGDLNTTGATGCEYTCPVNPPTAEFCDGVDNDCDDQIDEGLTPPAGFCNQGQAGSPCQGVTASCFDYDGGGPLPHSWYCQYPPTVEVDPANPNQLLGYETLCDGADGDCDGTPDDNFGLGSVCDNGYNGACRVEGTLICDPGDPLSTTCDLPPSGTWPTPTDEVCDGTDNDCDGLTDENYWQNLLAANDPPDAVQYWVVEDLVTVTTNGYQTDMYRYEASRPAASWASAGAGNNMRSCSKGGDRPWGFVTYYQAKRACARAGMRLCNGDQWYDACSGGGSNAYPYGGAYQGQTCNGHDRYTSVDKLDVTGAAVNASCRTAASNIFDMSGNLREWTDHLVGITGGGEPIYRLRGGGYFDLEEGLGCGFDSSAYVATVQGEHVGFRCCSTCGNGTVEPWETCDGGASCNPIFCGPITCGDGNLDAGEDCDDGNLLPTDGCDETCRIETLCGDGVTEGTEQCDDGNTVDLDFCDNDCQDAPTEGEPNGNASQADSNNHYTESVFVIGAWGSVGDQDYYAIDLPAGATIHVETFDSNGPVSCSGIDTVVNFYSTNGVTLLATNDDGGPSLCSDLTYVVGGAGTYYVLVYDWGNNNTGNYTVRITVTP